MIEMHSGTGWTVTVRDETTIWKFGSLLDDEVFSREVQPVLERILQERTLHEIVTVVERENDLDDAVWKAVAHEVKQSEIGRWTFVPESATGVSVAHRYAPEHVDMSDSSHD